MNKVVISQPMLFPWSGYFEQLMLADEYIYLDDVQFSKGSFTNRIQVLNGENRSWMTIPLIGKGTHQNIIELQPVNTDWKTSHLDLLKQSLKGAPHLDDALKIVEEVYVNENLCDLLIASTEIPAQYMGIGMTRKLKRSSQMDVTGTSSQRVLDLVCAVSGTHYLTGHGAANYLDHELFERAGVTVEYMCYSCTAWTQPRTEFIPYVSILDLIARTGKSARNFLLPATKHWRDFTNGTR